MLRDSRPVAVIELRLHIPQASYKPKINHTLHIGASKKPAWTAKIRKKELPCWATFGGLGPLFYILLRSEWAFWIYLDLQNRFGSGLFEGSCQPKQLSEVVQWLNALSEFRKAQQVFSEVQKPKTIARSPKAKKRVQKSEGLKAIRNLKRNFRERSGQCVGRA